MGRVLLAAMALLVLAVAAWADGGIYPRAAVVKPVRTPDQKALLRWDEKTGTETLVIETTLAGEGTEFAWILPLPAAPEIEASTTGLFPTLEVVCGPRVWTKTSAGWWVLLVPVFAVALYVAGRRHGVAGWFAMYLGGGLLISVAAVIVPTMQEKFPGVAPAVRVLSRETVGAFDTATLAAKDAGDLRRWLDENGFGAPAAIDPVVAEYIREGWVFVASKVRAEAASDGVRRVHPLAFTFPTKAPVYPMRLTGATNETLALDLFVLGSRRAETDGLEVVCCDVSAVGEMRAYGMDGHAELSRRAGESRVLTRLTGTLSGDAMQRDVVVLWRDVATVRPTYRTAAVALTESGAAAGVTCIGALFIATLLRGLRRVRGSDWTADAVRFDLCASGIGAAAAFVVAWLTIPTLPGGAHPIERDAYRDWPFHHDRMPSEPLRDVAAARAWAASAAAGHLNPYTDDPIREEDSPGNYVVREREGRVELATYVGMRNDVWEQVMDLSAPPR